MRPFTARRLALAVLVPALLVLSVIPGCSNQSEGERCGDDNNVSNNDDCESGLVCTHIAEGINRCCDPHRVTDSRCVIGGSTSATSHGGGSGIAAAGAPSMEAGAPGMTPDLGMAGMLSAGAGGS